MKTQFYILLSLKTPLGFQTYGQYFLGNNREEAEDLFAQLKGNKTVTDLAILHIDFMETIDELPITIKTICCTLEELSYNCKLITKETFKRLNLEDM